jgi:hypothetical protein
MASRALKIDPKSANSEAASVAPESRLTDTGQRMSPDEIAARSYELWQERGCPAGSPEVDWFRAEQELRNRRTQTAE